jgi:hypothetical protein
MEPIRLSDNTCAVPVSAGPRNFGDLVRRSNTNGKAIRQEVLAKRSTATGGPHQGISLEATNSGTATRYDIAAPDQAADTSLASEKYAILI